MTVLVKGQLESQEVTDQEVKLKSAGLISQQSVLLGGTWWMRAYVFVVSHLSSATNLLTADSGKTFSFLKPELPYYKGGANKSSHLTGLL